MAIGLLARAAQWGGKAASKAKGLFSSGVADDAARGAASLGDDAAKAAAGSADDAARAAEELAVANRREFRHIAGGAGHADDVARGATSLGDDAAKAAAGSADDVARAATKSIDDSIQTAREAGLGAERGRVGEFARGLLGRRGVSRAAEAGKFAKSEGIESADDLAKFYKELGLNAENPRAIASFVRETGLQGTSEMKFADVVKGFAGQLTRSQGVIDEAATLSRHFVVRHRTGLTRAAAGAGAIGGSAYGLHWAGEKAGDGIDAVSESVNDLRSSLGLGGSSDDDPENPERSRGGLLNKLMGGGNFFSNLFDSPLKLGLLGAGGLALGGALGTFGIPGMAGGGFLGGLIGGAIKIISSIAILGALAVGAVKAFGALTSSDEAPAATPEVTPDGPAQQVETPARTQETGVETPAPAVPQPLPDTTDIDLGNIAHADHTRLTDDARLPEVVRGGEEVATTEKPSDGRDAAKKPKGTDVGTPG